VSFVEAVEAANNTLGPKSIAFAPSLAGKSIPFGSDDPQQFLFVAIRSGDLTIDGDIDGDRAPDVTLDATNRPYGAGIDIRSSNVTINGLHVVEAGNAILFACTDEACASRTIANVRITNNVIETQHGGGIEIGVWGLLSFSNGPFLSGITFTDFTIEGNTIRSKSAAIGLRPSVGSAARNHATNITIRGNRLTAGNAIDVGAADDSNPPFFSDDSLIENLVIEDNVIENSPTGIDVYGANLGNQRATVRNVRIANNRISGVTYCGMYFIGGGNPRARATSGNVFDGLVISGNDIGGGGFGILMSGGDLDSGPQQDASPVDDNTISNVMITNNDIHGYGRAGLQVWGGFANPSVGPHSASRNRAANIVISNNTFRGDPAHRDATTGIEIVAGDSRGGSAAIGNYVRADVSGNVVSGNAIAFSFAGGRGSGAHDNLLELTYDAANIVDQNGRTVVSTADAEGASGNRIAYPRRRSSTR
jgi:hypothetical protein